MDENEAVVPEALAIDAALASVPNVQSMDDALASKEIPSPPAETTHTLTPEIVAYSTAALDYQIPAERVAQSMHRLVSPSGAIKEVAYSLIEEDKEMLKQDAQIAASMGQPDVVESYARAYQAQSTLSQRLSDAKALSIITTKAVENTATRSPTTVENNTPAQLGKVAREQGLRAAMAMQMDQIAEAKGLKTGAVEAVGSIAAAVGGLWALGAISGPLGWAGSAALTLNAVADQKVIRDAIKKHAKIDVGEVWGITDTLEPYHALLETLSPEQALAVNEKVVADVLEKSNRIPFLGKVFATGSAMSIHTGARNAPGLDISAQLRDNLDATGVGLDIAPVLKYLKHMGSPAKSLEIAAGGDSVGRQLADDIVRGRNTLNTPEPQQIEWSLSSNFEQMLPEGIKGTAGSVQKALMEKSAQLLKELDARIAVSGDESVKQIRNFVADHFEMAPTSIAKYDAATGELVLQHPGRAAPFTSEKTAKAFADNLEKETGWKLEVRSTNSASRPFIDIDDVDDFLPAKRIKIENAELAEVVSRQGTAREALSAIEGFSKSAPLKELASRLLNNKALGLDAVSLTDIREFEKAAAGSKVTGLYRYLEDSIGLEAAKRIPSESTVLHEIVHSVTSQIIDTVLLSGKRVGKTVISAANITPDQRFAVNALNQVFKKLSASDIKMTFMGGKHPMKDISELGLDAARVAEHPDFAKYYGISNVHEMIAEATTNKDFARVLKNIPIRRLIKDDTLLEMLGGTVRTVWDAMTKAWHKVLGITSPKEASALDVIVENTMKLVDSATESQRTSIKALADAGKLTEADLMSVRGANAASSLSHGYYVHLAPQSRAMHSAEDIATRFGPGGDPKHRASMESMHDRFVSLLQEQRDKKLIATYIKDTIGKLNRAEFQRVNKVLVEGDVLKKEFTDVDLFARGVRTDKEKTAYYAFRFLENMSLRVKNNHIVDQLSKEGWMQGYIKVGADVVQSPVSPLNAAMHKGQQAYDLATGQWRTLDGTEQGLFRSRQSVEVAAGKEATMFLRTTDEIKVGQWAAQLPMLPGSYRRIYNQDYFGQVRISRNVNGEMVDDVLNLRTSNNGKDIAQWATGMNNILKELKANPGNVSLRFVEENVGKWENAEAILTSIRNGEWDNYQLGGFGHHYDRETTNYVTSLTKTASDAYDLERRARGIKLESIDKVNNVLSPMDALGAELSNISRIRNVAQWRDKWVDVWWNTFGSTVDSRFVAGRKPIEVMTDKNFQMSLYTGGEQSAKFAESQRNYILQQLGGQTVDERYIEGALRRITFSHLNKYVQLPGMDEPVHIGHWIRHADPLQFARSFNFHTMLGAFNPAQLIVQSQAMVNAIAASPIHGMKAALTMPLLRVALMSDNPAVWKTVSKAAIGMDSTEFAQTVQAIRKSGLLDGIAATSMHNVEAGAFNMFNGWAGRVGEKSAFFFNRGEEAARLTAFEVARREWQAANVGADFTSADALKNILARTDDLTQNMTKANLAFYQRGILSIPGQYLQYNLKLAANLLGSFQQKGAGRGFTHGEAGRIIAAQLMGYGLAGNGLMFMYDEITGGMKATEEQKLALVEGGFAWLANAASVAITGEEMKLGLGSRLGTFNFYHDIVEAAVRADTSWWKAALGASATIPKKIGSLRYLADPFLVGDLSPEAFAMAGNKVLKETFSSWNNSTKALYAQQHEGKMVSTQGVIIGNLSPMEIVAQAFGMPAAETKDWYRWIASEKEMRTSVKDFAKEYMRLDEIRVKLLTDTGGKYNEQIDLYTAAQASIVQAVPVGFMDTFDAERNRIWDAQFSTHGQPKLVDRYIDLMARGGKLDDVSRIKEYGMKE